MNFSGPEPKTLEVSLDNFKEVFKRYLYERGYGRKQGESIVDVSFGPLTENLIPIQFWIEGEDEGTIVNYA
jgi:hypothetical protein